MAPEFQNQNQSSPDDLRSISELRAQIAALTARVEALERRQRAPLFVSEPTARAGQSGLGLTVVNRVGAVTLALGILFFFKYAAENNWIGPVARVALGYVAGVAFLWFAEYLNRRKQSVLSQGVAGCGIAILYTASYAASAYYKLLLHGFSFVLMLGVCGLGLSLAVRYASQILAGFGIGLAFFALPLMHTQLYVGLSFPCLLISAGLAIWVAVRQKWAVLVPFSAAAGTLSASFVEGEPLWFALYSFLLTGLLWFARTRVDSTVTLANTLYVTGHACLLIGGLRLIAGEMSEASVALTVASLLLAFYGIALLTSGVVRSASVDRLTGLSLIGLVIVKLYFYDVWLLSYGFRITAFVVLGVLLLVASFVYSRYRAHG